MVSTLSPARIQEFWDWFAVSLFMLISIDTLTTWFAAAAVGPGPELNPFVAWLLRQPAPVIIGVNLVAVVLAVGSFHFLLRLLEISPQPYAAILARSIEIWLGILVAAGLFVFANNLSVIVNGHSLVVI